MIPGIRPKAILKDWNIPLSEIIDAEEQYDQIQVERYETKKLVIKKIELRLIEYHKQFKKPVIRSISTTYHNKVVYF